MQKQIPQELLDNILSQIAENKQQESIDETALTENLQYFLDNPINLNTTNKEELEKLEFLSDTQIENLLYYKYMYFPMESIYELQLIEGFYGQDIRNLLPFVYVEKVVDNQTNFDWKKLFKYSKQEITIRYDQGLEKKAGYKSVDANALTENPNKEYLGEAFYHSLKYRFHSSNRIYAGITAEKDAGEQFWGEQHKGYDFYSAHLQINDLGIFKTITLGDYGASFGQGLLINTQFGFGKSALVLNAANRYNGLQRYGSTNEYGFLRGGGCTLKYKQLELTTFYSNRNIDADTTNGIFGSFKEDGLHRTLEELSRKQTVNLQILGTHANLKLQALQLGFSGLHMQLDHELKPTPAPYNIFYSSGKSQSGFSVDYQFRWKKFYGFGETALSSTYAWATINGLNINPSSCLSVLILHRYFAKDYNMLFANSFGENSRTNNEEGLYLGAEFRPLPKWKFSAYADSYRFPWLKYGLDRPSDGYDYLLQADFYPKRNIYMYMRFRFEQKQDNMANDTCTLPDIQDYKHASLRYRLQYSFNENMKLCNTLESSYSQKGNEKDNWGYLLSQDISYSNPNAKWAINLRYEMFDALNYENRFYAYESDILNVFSVPLLYGKGSKYYLNLRYSLCKNLCLYFKIAQTCYSNRETIGTGLEEISRNRKTDMRFLIKWKW